MALLTPLTSYKTCPGRILHIHRLTEPLPLPIRISEGFDVTGFDENTRIHIFPKGLIFLLIACLTDSICLSVILPPSTAFNPQKPLIKLQLRPDFEYKFLFKR